MNNTHINYFAYPYNERIAKEKAVFANPLEGFIKGNMQNDLYQGYKNYSIEPTVEINGDLLPLMTYSFACNDLGLYLDLHPTDMKALALFNECKRNYDVAVKQYEADYGPLSLMMNTGNTWEWLSNWPWEVE